MVLCDCIWFKLHPANSDRKQFHSNRSISLLSVRLPLAHTPGTIQRRDSPHRSNVQSCASLSLTRTRTQSESVNCTLLHLSDWFGLTKLQMLSVSDIDMFYLFYTSRCLSVIVYRLVNHTDEGCDVCGKRSRIQTAAAIG